MGSVVWEWWRWRTECFSLLDHCHRSRGHLWPRHFMDTKGHRLGESIKNTSMWSLEISGWLKALCNIGYVADIRGRLNKSSGKVCHGQSEGSYLFAFLQQRESSTPISSVERILTYLWCFQPWWLGWGWNWRASLAWSHHSDIVERRHGRTFTHLMVGRPGRCRRVVDDGKWQIFFVKFFFIILIFFFMVKTWLDIPEQEERWRYIK